MSDNATVPLENTLDTDCITTSGRLRVSVDRDAWVSARDMDWIFLKAVAVRSLAVANLSGVAFIS